MIKINFDKRLELIFGLMYSVYREFNINDIMIFTNDEEYCNEFYNMYKAYSSNELSSYIKSGGLDTYNRILEIALALNENYEIEENENIKKIENNNINFNKEKLEKLLKEFVEKSNYEEFYNNHKNYYDSLKNKFIEAINIYVNFNENLISDFYGYKLKDSEIKLYNFSKAGFGYSGKDKNIIVCNTINKDGEATYTDKIITNLFHEFSHPYCNPLGEKYFNHIDLSNLLNEAKENGLQSSYNKKIIFINEYIVRTIQTYLCRKYVSEEYFNFEIERHKKLGYIHIDKLIMIFNSKDKYETFEEFYKEEIVPFFIKINNVYEGDNMNKYICTNRTSNYKDEVENILNQRKKEILDFFEVEDNGQFNFNVYIYDTQQELKEGLLKRNFKEDPDHMCACHKDEDNSLNYFEPKDEYSENEWNKEKYKKVIFHEEIHGIQYLIYGTTPEWINEGIANYLDGTYSKGIKYLLENYINKIEVPEMEELINEFGRHEYDSYDYSYLIVSYLIETLGKKNFLELLKDKNKLDLISNDLTYKSVEYYNNKYFNNKIK